MAQTIPVGSTISVPDIAATKTRIVDLAESSGVPELEELAALLIGHNLALSDAIRELSLASFTPVTTVSNCSADTTINTTSYASVTGVSQSITSPVPARVVATAELKVVVTTPGKLTTRILQDATVLRETEWSPQAAILVEDPNPHEETLIYTCMFDIEPTTVHVIDVQCKIDVGSVTVEQGTASPQKNSSLMIRVEPRSLI